MADELKKIFTLKVVGTNELIEAKQVLDSYKKSLDEAIKTNDVDRINSFGTAIEQQKLKIKDLTKSISDQNKEFKAIPGSLQQMEIQLARYRSEFKKLTDDQRNSSKGKETERLIKSLSESINVQKLGIGDATSNIGKYTESIRKAFDNPLKFLKNAGLVGLFVTAGSAVAKFGQQAIEAFENVEGGKKRLEGVKLGFEQMKAVGSNALAKIVEGILPLVEKYLPAAVKVVNFLVAAIFGFGSGAFAVFKNVASEVGKFVNDLKIGYLSVKKFLNIGDQTENQKQIDELKQKNKELTASHIDVFKAAKDSFNAQLSSGETAIKNARLQTEATQKAVGELERLKKKEEELQKVIENKIALNKDATKEIEEQRKIQDKIFKIENDIQFAQARTIEAQLAAKKKELEEIISRSAAGTKEYNDALIELAKTEERLIKLTEARAEAEFQAEQLAKGLTLEVRKRLREQESSPIGALQTLEIKPVISETSEQKLKDKINKIADFNANKADELNAKLRKKDEDEEAKKNQRRLQVAKEFLQQEIELAAQFALDQIERDKEQNDKRAEERIKSVESEYETKREFARGNAELIKKLDDEERQKKEQIEKEQAKRNSQLAIKKILIEGALAAAKTFATYGFPLALPFVALQAAAILKQISVIKAQGLKEGGLPKFNDPLTMLFSRFFKGHFGSGLVKGQGSRTSDSVPAMLSRDEYVLPGVMVDFFGLNQLEAIRKRLIYGLGNVSNVARKANGGYLGTASSGFIPNFQNSTGNSSLTASLQNVTASFNKESIILLSEYMSQNTADAVYNATKRGLNDGRKRFEREQYSDRIAKR